MTMDSSSLQKLVDLLRPLTEPAYIKSEKAGELIGPAALVENLIELLRDKLRHEHTEENSAATADVLRRLEHLRDSRDDEEQLFVIAGLYAGLVAIAWASKMAESIRLGAGLSDQVSNFWAAVDTLMKFAYPDVFKDPKGKQLIKLTKAAMTVPFQFTQGQRGVMTPAVMKQMHEWMRAVSGDRVPPLTQLQSALGNFLDAQLKAEQEAGHANHAA